MSAYEEHVVALRKKVNETELANLNGIEKAVWGAAYVRILAAAGTDLHIIDVVEMLGEPTEHHLLLAIDGANSAVLSLRDRFDMEKLI